MPMDKAASIGIIGGADGPTAIFITGQFSWKPFLLFLIVVSACIYFIRKKYKKNPPK